MSAFQKENQKLELEHAINLMDLKKRNLIINKTIMSLRAFNKAVLTHIYINKKTRVKTAEVMKKSRQWVDLMIDSAHEEYLKKRNEKV